MEKRDVLGRDILYKIIRIGNHSKFDMYWKLYYFVGEVCCLLDMLYFYISACFELYFWINLSPTSNVETCIMFEVLVSKDGINF
jgi:hypothetical protein